MCGSSSSGPPKGEPQLVQVGVGVDEAGHDGPPLGVNAPGLRNGRRGLCGRADPRNTAVADGQGRGRDGPVSPAIDGVHTGIRN